MIFSRTGLIAAIMGVTMALTGLSVAIKIFIDKVEHAQNEVTEMQDRGVANMRYRIGQTDYHIPSESQKKEYNKEQDNKAKRSPSSFR